MEHSNDETHHTDAPIIERNKEITDDVDSVDEAEFDLEANQPLNDYQLAMDMMKMFHS